MATAPNLLPIGNQSFSPMWWAQQLAAKMNARRTDLKKFNDYYNGDHDLSFASQRFLDAFGGQFKELADNYCPVVVQAPAERMKVQGISLPSEDTSNGAESDQAAWNMWQRNDMDMHADIQHTQTLTTGYGYNIIWADDDGDAVITVEDPLQVIVAYESGTPRRRAAALKRWVDEWTGYEFATLYLPDNVFKFRSRTQTQGVGIESIDTGMAEVGDWVARSDDWVLDNPLGVVPVVEFLNDPTVSGQGRSELQSVLPLQDAINKLTADMILASEYGAYRQRAIIGWEPEKDENGKPQSPFQAALERVWTLASPDAKVVEFSATDLNNYVGAKESLVKDMATQSRTPRHYFYQSGQAPSGDSIKSAETGLVAKTRRHMLPAENSHLETIRIGFLVEGDDAKAKAFTSQIDWRDPEYRSEGELTDAVIKQFQAGLITWEFALKRLGFSGPDIDKMRGQRTTEQVLSQGLNLDALSATPPEAA